MRDVTTTERASRRLTDVGQAVLALAFVAVIAALAAMGVARLGAGMVQRQQAQAAADAVALAAVNGGESRIENVAAANGAEVVRVTWLGEDVMVEVVVHHARAVARATRAP